MPPVRGRGAGRPLPGRAGGGRRRTLIDPRTVEDPYGREVIERLMAAGAALALALVDGPYGLPVCLAYLWSEDVPTVFAGGGCHTGPAIALTRAVTEAAQSRLTAIAGTRDDLAGDPAPLDSVSFRPARTEELASWSAAARFAPPRGGFADQRAGGATGRGRHRS
ncbi:YcaO-like family protein [Streptomyces sp. NPDC014889]|uniref:YcaO-like family protein n=1 Tax=Streptomyces sp. NPDC014889 TaxID=3364928 RepID=UPI0036FA2A74